MSAATYDAANRRVSQEGQTLTYDAAGNLTEDAASPRNTYTWDARGQLESISGAENATFGYDPFGRRQRKTVDGGTTDFLYDGHNVVQELSNGIAVANLLTGFSLDQRFARTTASGTNSFLTDALGSTVALSDALGGIPTSYTYEPFGEATTAGPTTDNPYQYTGRENDGTGLYHYRARYYSPSMQRFISEDPVGFTGGDVNLQAYVKNNPVNFTDPSGLKPFSFGDPLSPAPFFCDPGSGSGTAGRKSGGGPIATECPTPPPPPDPCFDGHAGGGLFPIATHINPFFQPGCEGLAPPDQPPIIPLPGPAPPPLPISPMPLPTPRPQPVPVPVP
jgi:RHS repeat-associated protein